MSLFGKLTYIGRMKIEITKQDARKVTIIEKLIDGLRRLILG